MSAARELGLGTDGPERRFARSERPSERPGIQTLSGESRVARWASPWWLLFLGLAVAEVMALFVRIERVPSDAEWARAAEIVRDKLESTDAVIVAPSWADPILRLHLGDRITTKMAGRVDLSSFERLWVLSIRGARSPEAPARTADFEQVAGKITIRRYDFGPTPVVLDLVDALPSATVDITRKGVREECPWRERLGGPARGGLGFGPVVPRQRFVCDERKSWLWVGTTVIEDLSLSPRRCVWQHPQGNEPVSVTFHDVHLGQKVVLYGGLYYLNERDEKGAPVTMRVLVDDIEVGRLVHHDGDGMLRVEIPTHPKARKSDSARGDLRLEVTTPQPYHRSFCWAGSIRDATRREAP